MRGFIRNFPKTTIFFMLIGIGATPFGVAFAASLRGVNLPDPLGIVTMGFWMVCAILALIVVVVSSINDNWKIVRRY